MKYLVDIFSTVFNFNGASYCILFTITLCINKHILSSFNFTYPTVLQGWQTATTTLIMFLLKSVDREKYKESVHAPGFTIFAPHLVFHVLQLVTGSKALSLLPVPVFLCGVNTSEAIINLVLKSDNRFINLIGASVILTSGIVLLWKYYELTKVGACVWFVAYIVVFTADSLYCGLVDMKVNRLSRLFYINLFSAITLFPLSVVSEEIYEAVEFGWTKGALFSMCFVTSGVCTGITQLLALQLQSAGGSRRASTAALLLSACCAHALFVERTFASPLFHLVFVNLASNLLLFSPAPDHSVFGEYTKLELELV
ncbi:transmembrane protein 241-like isoform X2 [Nilaparvata lugens]|uniref:transmembrane protein 241-like isoform X2 n=2 Tax=Nilaparvata lugens TaxID=108931 RepID=UPI00193D2B68|nr:transmembrane protein 241-like isoform X2 [Nilaparvata lugens]